MAEEVKTGAPSDVISLATPHRAKYCLSTLMMWALSSLARRNMDNQLEYLSAIAR